MGIPTLEADVHATRYKDQPAVTLESEVIQAQFLPTLGAKMCSLVHKPTSTEVLVQRPAPHYRVATYAGDYVGQGECSGLDEMFPSIDSCAYARYPWQGSIIPDHGEVWSLPWQWYVEGETLYFRVHGVRFPYRLEKRIAFTAPTTLRSAYRLTNLSPFDLDFLWAAHGMFQLEENATLTLPPGVEGVVTRLPFNGSLGGVGDCFAWPQATLPDGTIRDLRLMRGRESRDAVKYFVQGRLPEGWCELTYPHSGFSLRLGFPVEQVPYLAVLVDEGGWDDLYSVFLEPITAPHDRLDATQASGHCTTVPGGATYEWYLDLSLAATNKAPRYP